MALVRCFQLAFSLCSIAVDQEGRDHFVINRKLVIMWEKGSLKIIVPFYVLVNFRGASATVMIIYFLLYKLEAKQGFQYGILGTYHLSHYHYFERFISLSI